MCWREAAAARTASTCAGARLQLLGTHRGVRCDSCTGSRRGAAVHQHHACVVSHDVGVPNDACDGHRVVRPAAARCDHVAAGELTHGRSACEIVNTSEVKMQGQKVLKLYVRRFRFDILKLAIMIRTMIILMECKIE